jgi:hypothetical protein
MKKINLKPIQSKDGPYTFKQFIMSPMRIFTGAWIIMFNILLAFNYNMFEETYWYYISQAFLLFVLFVFIRENLKHWDKLRKYAVIGLF